MEVYSTILNDLPKLECSMWRDLLAIKYRLEKIQRLQLLMML